MIRPAWERSILDDSHADGMASYLDWQAVR
jgi:hypothetical protein